METTVLTFLIEMASLGGGAGLVLAAVGVVVVALWVVWRRR
jgi:hypothetical protein